MIEIDGGTGEGGGQLLRTALSLSCVTGKPFRIFHIRKNRSKPGLMPQHLVSVQAAARISGAEVTGDRLGSGELSFQPHALTPGDYSFDIGTAGSIALVLQTLIPPLLRAGGESRITLTGGTHVPFSPSWHYLAHIFAPVLFLVGARIELQLVCCGFYPKGGGRVRCAVFPCTTLAPFNLEARGALQRVSGYSAVGNLPLSIAERQGRSTLGRLRDALGDLPSKVSSFEVGAAGAGSFVFLTGEYENGVAGFTSLGARGKPAEVVGEEAAEEFLRHHLTGMPVDPHLADQLVPYLAQADGTSVFATSRITGHLETNLQVTALFLDIESRISGSRDQAGTVTIVPCPRPNFG